MRNETEVLSLLVSWGIRTPGIRGMVLTSSRANPTGHPDLFSDYDIEIVVTDSRAFLQLGNLLPEAGKVLHSYSEDHTDHSMRLVLYTDYVRIDYTIYEPPYLDQVRALKTIPLHWNLGYTVLLDKDHVYAGLPPPRPGLFHIHPPDQQAFLAVVQEFWWDLPYVAKALWRCELFYARYMLDGIIRPNYLQKMIEWDIGSKHGWEVTTNKHGRLFNRLLDSNAQQELEATYAGSEPGDNWKALFAVAALFHRLAEALGKQLHYSYPAETATAMLAYLQEIREGHSGAPPND